MTVSDYQQHAVLARLRDAEQILNDSQVAIVPRVAVVSLAGIVSGGWPALRASRVAPTTILREG